MAGILANSASATMVAGDTAVDNNRSGYLTGEKITLTTNPTGSTYSWGLAAPSGSAAARSALNDDDAATVTFTPDVGGYYVVTCTVDGSTFYVLRLSVTAAVVGVTQEALRLQPKADSAVTAPSSGVALYYSTTQDALAIKKPDGSVHTIDITAVP